MGTIEELEKALRMERLALEDQEQILKNTKSSVSAMLVDYHRKRVHCFEETLRLRRERDE